VSEGGHEKESDVSSQEEPREDWFEASSGDFRKGKETAGDSLDINKFISEQEEFIRNLNRKNNHIREEIQNYDYSDEAKSSGEENETDNGVVLQSIKKVAESQKTRKLPPPKPVTKPKLLPQEGTSASNSDSNFPEGRRAVEKGPAKPSKDSQAKEARSDRVAAPSFNENYDEDEESESINLSSEVQKAASSSGKLSRKKVAKLTEIAEIEEEEDSQGSHIFIRNEGHQSQSRRREAHESEGFDVPTNTHKNAKEAKDSAFLKKILQGYDLSESEEEGDKNTPTSKNNESVPKRKLNIVNVKDEKGGSQREDNVQATVDESPKEGKAPVKDKEEMKRLRAKRMAYKPVRPDSQTAKKTESMNQPNK
jgi:hypothetical protein